MQLCVHSSATSVIKLTKSKATLQDIVEPTRLQIRWMSSGPSSLASRNSNRLKRQIHIWGSPGLFSGNPHLLQSWQILPLYCIAGEHQLWRRLSGEELEVEEESRLQCPLSQTAWIWKAPERFLSFLTLFPPCLESLKRQQNHQRWRTISIPMLPSNLSRNLSVWI